MKSWNPECQKWNLPVQNYVEIVIYKILLHI